MNEKRLFPEIGWKNDSGVFIQVHKSSLLTLKKCPLKSKLLKTLKKLLSLPLILK